MTTSLLSEDYSTPVRGLHHSCQTTKALLSEDMAPVIVITSLLSKNYVTPVRRLSVLSGDCNTPVIILLHHSCHRTTSLLSDNYITPVTGLHHFCHRTTSLLSQDYITHHSCQEHEDIKDYKNQNTVVQFTTTTRTALNLNLARQTDAYKNSFFPRTARG